MKILIIILVSYLPYTCNAQQYFGGNGNGFAAYIITAQHLGNAGGNPDYAGGSGNGFT